MIEPVVASSTRPAHPLRTLMTALAMAVVALLVVGIASASAAELPAINLAKYKKVAEYELPTVFNNTAPNGWNLLAEEASGVTYDWENEMLYVVGDGGTGLVEVNKEGKLESTMTFAEDPSGPQHTTFYDTEGVAFVGNGEFVITEERRRQIDKFKYEAGGELTRAKAETVKLGTEIGNIGLEGVSNDPISTTPSEPGLILSKEQEPEGIFQTNVEWAAGTATNGSATTEESTNLFEPAKAGVLDMSDVFALANLRNVNFAELENLLIISQESGKIVNVTRSGEVKSSLTIISKPGNRLTVPEQTDEGVTMDEEGNLYVVNEDGGGSQEHPQLWVYEEQTTPDEAPTAVTLSNETNSLVESPTALPKRVKVAAVTVEDNDGFGENNLEVTGPDAADFEVDSNGLYLKAHTTLNAAAKSSYEVNVAVNDPAVGSDPDATTLTPYKLTVVAASPGSSSDRVAITEVAPWSNENSPFGADWFELTNTGTGAINLAGWKADDSHDSVTVAGQLEGVPTLAPGQSAVFVQGESTIVEGFESDWFPGGLPSGVQIGYYETGHGLSATENDQVNVFNSLGQHAAGVEFGASPASAPFTTFENPEGLGSGSGAPPLLTTMAAVGTDGAFAVDGGTEVGSPGTAVVPTPVAVTEVAPWGSNFAEYNADWFELTNETAVPIELNGWKMDDNSHEFAKAVPLLGVETLEPGESAIFVEAPEAATPQEAAEVVTKWETSWFGAGVPAGLQVGTYQGKGVGLSEGGDGVNIYDAEGSHLTGVKFGANEPTTAFPTFDNSARLGSFSGEAEISTLSVDGTDGAFTIHDQTGSPGTTVEVTPPSTTDVKITEVDPTGDKSTAYGADWFELTDTGSSAVSLTGWKIDDSSDEFAKAVPLVGVETLAPGQSAVFLELEHGVAKAAAFEAAWFPGGVPAGFLIGSYEGSGVGLSSGGDQVNIFEAGGEKVTGVAFGTATTGVSFDNAFGMGSKASPPPTISALSKAGADGAFLNGDGEIGSPGTAEQTDALLEATTPAFPPQPAGTIGPGQWITVTNAGFEPAQISKVAIEELNPESAGDFLLSADHCSGKTLEPEATCQLQVRFAPGRANAGSSAELVIDSNALNASFGVPLAATSTGLPEGPTGPAGPTGPGGPTGPTGPAGPSGPQGEPGPSGPQGAGGATGAQGEKGADGAMGATGATGPQGPAGAQGPAGPQGPAGKNGKNGKDGKDGVVEFVASESDAQARRGHTAQLKFKIKNETAGALRGAEVSASSLGANGTSSVAVDTIKAGRSEPVTLDLQVGRNAFLGRHRVKVELQVGGHTVTQTVIVKVTR